MHLFSSWTLVLFHFFALVVSFSDSKNIALGSANQKLSQHIAFEMYDSEVRQSILDFRKEELTILGFASVDELALKKEIFNLVRKISSKIENEIDSEEDLKTVQNLLKQEQIKKINKIIIETWSKVQFQILMSELVGIDVATTWLDENRHIQVNEFEGYLMDLVWQQQFNSLSKHPKEFKKYLFSRFAKELRTKMSEKEIESAELLFASNKSLFEKFTRCTVTVEE